MTDTLEMSVYNTGFLLDRFSQDCGPLQYVRELTQNSIEAIRKAGREKGTIVWSFDDLTFERSGIKKLSITDNGCGMGADELVRYINSLSSSGSVQSLDGNYGIGAKISSAARNHAGVEYLSWKDGQGSTICLWKDPVSGAYGLKPFIGLDTVDHVADLNQEAIAKFGPIKECGSGTHVVLHGKTENEDTFSISDEIQERGAGRWLVKYLNTRYYRIPSNIRISCRVAGGGDEGFRQVTGQGVVLDAIAGENRGHVALKNATAHWWIVPPKDATLENKTRIAGSSKATGSMKTFNPSHYTTGHLAAIYQDELHDTMRGTQGRALLQQCGVLIGYDQVVIYIEPVGSGVAPNMARTLLLIDGESLPWGDWADEFRSKLPKAIKDFMAQIQPPAHDSKSEDERMKSVMDLYKITKYKPDAAGTALVTEPDSGGSPIPGGSPRNGTGSTGTRGGRKSSSAYSELLSPSGTRASAIVASQDFPQLSWVSVEDGTRPEDMYPRHAAWFTHPNTISANADFGGLRTLIDKFCEHYPDNAGARVVIAQVVREWWSQTLRECIQGLRGLVGSGVWTRSQLMKMLSDNNGADVLTASVMPKYLVYQQMHRQISGRLGKAHVPDDAPEQATSAAGAN